jgi:hypothetical protein
MTPQELKDRSHKSITAPVTGADFQIRRLTFLEITEARFNGILGDTKSEEPQKAEPNFDSFLTAARAAAMGERMESESVRHILKHGVVSPKVVFAEQAGEPVPDDAVDVRWIAEDLKWLVNQILAFSGLTEKESAKVKEFTKNDQASTSSIVSQKDMDASLTKSST